MIEIAFLHRKLGPDTYPELGTGRIAIKVEGIDINSIEGNESGFGSDDRIFWFLEDLLRQLNRLDELDSIEVLDTFTRVWAPTIRRSNGTYFVRCRNIETPEYDVYFGGKGLEVEINIQEFVRELLSKTRLFLDSFYAVAVEHRDHPRLPELEELFAQLKKMRSLPSN